MLKIIKRDIVKCIKCQRVPICSHRGDMLGVDANAPRMDSAVRLLDHVVHCLDESPWPFSIEEILSTLGCSSLQAFVPAMGLCCLTCSACEEPDRVHSSNASWPKPPETHETPRCDVHFDSEASYAAT